jgi:hypothetical protein
MLEAVCTSQTSTSFYETAYCGTSQKTVVFMLATVKTWNRMEFGMLGAYTTLEFTTPNPMTTWVTHVITYAAPTVLLCLPACTKTTTTHTPLRKLCVIRICCWSQVRDDVCIAEDQEEMFQHSNYNTRASKLQLCAKRNLPCTMSRYSNLQNLKQVTPDNSSLSRCILTRYCEIPLGQFTHTKCDSYGIRSTRNIMSS